MIVATGGVGHGEAGAQNPARRRRVSHRCIEAMQAAFRCEVVGWVATVAEVERLAAAEPLDGAVLDVNLCGLRALPALRARQIPVVLSSGYGSSALFPKRSGICRFW